MAPGVRFKPPEDGPKILTLDIETAPMLAHVWKIWDENIGLSQLVSDWYVLSWAAKWLGDPPERIMYRDQRRSKDIEDDKALLAELRGLIDQADYLLTHNGRKFDNRKVNARLLIHGIKPPSPVKHLDTLALAKKHFAFTSNKLEFLTNTLNKKYTKLPHKDFPGFELWRECLRGNRAAWAAMEQYNKHDVLALEELYQQIAPWDSTSFAVYQKHDAEVRCKCGSATYKRNGTFYTGTRAYQRYRCSTCGHHWRDTRCIPGSATAQTGAAR